MEQDDVRWEQRFSNFRKALSKLGEVAGQKTVEALSELEKEGMIQRFEYTYELAWKTLQDLLKFKGYLDIAGPNPVLEQAFQDGYITNGQAWKQMKKARELTSHRVHYKLSHVIVCLYVCDKKSHDKRRIPTVSRDKMA